MDTILLAKFDGVNWSQIDIFDDIDIRLTVQQQDLTDLTQRRQPYSNTILLPDTSKNARNFEQYYEPNAQLFNPLNRIPCVVQYRGTNIFEGTMRFNKVINNQLSRNYEVYIFGNIVDFVAGFRDLQLQDLNFADLNHDLIYDNVVKSWENINDGFTGLFNGQILYPMINYGLDYQGDSTSGASPTFEYSFGQQFSFSLSGNAIPPTIFKPAIQLKTVLDRMFSKTNYEVESEFFDSQYFRSIYFDTYQNGNLGIQISQVDNDNSSSSAITNQNTFKANWTQESFRYKKDSIYNFRFNTNLLDGFDPLNNFDNTNQTFTVPYAGSYSWNMRFNIKLQDPLLIQGELVVEGLKNGSVFYTSPGISLFDSLLDPLPISLFITESCLAGDQITFRMRGTNAYIAIGVNFTNPREFTISRFIQDPVDTPVMSLELYDSPTLTGVEVNMKLGIPNISCIDFFRTIITLFNLVIYQDNNSKTVKIEPYNWYFSDNLRNRKDWTHKLDLSSTNTLEPLSFDLKKDLIYTYKDGGFEFLPKTFFGNNDFVYGRKKFTTTDNIFAGEDKYEIVFGSCPTSGVTGAPNFIIPQFYNLQNQQQQSYSTLPHLFFWVGNRYVYLDSLQTQQGEWYMLSGATPVAWNTYPCVSHLSYLDSELSEVVSDLNFQSTFDFFGNNLPQLVQFTDFNLYNTFWKTYIENLYSPQSKRLTGEFYFKPLDFYETKLNDKIFIKDADYDIEKIEQASLVNKELTTISLIKNSYSYYRIEPPAPVYTISPNQSYPTPEPFVSQTCYVSTNKTQVCLGTTPTLTTLYFAGGPNLENLDLPYIDTGTAFQILPIGTYVRQQTSSTTFVVINKFGRILETTC